MATLIADYPLSSTFAGITQLQCIGETVTGDSHPNGYPGRLEIIDGVMKSTIVDTDAATQTGIRSEVIAPISTRAEYWYLVDFMVPGTWDISVNTMSLIKIHDSPDGGDNPRWPNFRVEIRSGKLTTSVPNTTLPAEVASGRQMSVMDLEFNRWYRACLHVNWQINTTGFREFFIDGVPQFREFGVPTHYDDVVGPYLKVGTYDGTHNGGFGTLTSYYRNIKVYSGSASYPEMLGSVPLPPRRLVGV